MCHLKNKVCFDRLEINIPPGGVRDAVNLLHSQHKDIIISEDAILDLENKLFQQNEIYEQKAKEKELEKKQENDVIAK